MLEKFLHGHFAEFHQISIETIEIIKLPSVVYIAKVRSRFIKRLRNVQRPLTSWSDDIHFSDLNNNMWLTKSISFPQFLKIR